MLWNNSLGDHRAYFQTSILDASLKFQCKSTLFDDAFRHLKTTYGSSKGRDTFIEVSSSVNRKLCITDHTRLASKVKDVFGQDHLSSDEQTCSCSTLVRNKDTARYAFFFGD